MSHNETVEFEYEKATISITGNTDEYVFEAIKAANTFYELDLLEILLRLTRVDHGAYIDVGANIGNHTIFLAKFTECKVISIEPEKENFGLLNRNINDNNLGGKVLAHNVAAWHTSEKLSLFNDNPGNSGMFSVRESETGEVSGVTLDSIVGNEKISAIKVDVEGAELNVLRGSSEILRRFHPILSVEVHSSLIYRSINDYLSTFGYELVAIAGRSDNYVWCHNFSLATNISDARELIHLTAARNAIRKQARDINSMRRSMDSLSRQVTKLTEILGKTEKPE